MVRNLLVILACTSATTLAQAPAQAPLASAPATRHVGTMSELMVTVLRPASDAIFYVETRTPKDGDEWTRLEGQALMVAETANLMMLPGRARNDPRWMADAALMRDAGTAAFRAAKTRKVEAVAAVNDQLYESCTTCHTHFRPGYGNRAQAATPVTATPPAPPPPAEPRPAEPLVADRNRAALASLPFTDRQDFEDARRGFVATTPDARDPQRFQFLEGEAPPTVNPSLWRLAQLNAIDGLFKVVDGVYQVRGFSLGNMTIVEGQTGLIVIDPLSSIGAAEEAIALYLAHRPRKPVVAVVYTHSHSDHYGGVKGVVTAAEVAAGRTRVIAPAGFMEAVSNESVIAGNAMGRRAQFQFGGPLPRGARGYVDAGLGKNDGRGRPGRSVIAPTQSIAQPVETHTIDGVEIVFHLAPASEAPAEMHLYLPKHRVLNMAENVTQTLHNLLPLRGTEVRDAKGWSKYIGDALERFGRDADVMVAQHHWPVWGRQNVVRRLEEHRDLYKYLHDQTVRMMNQGLVPTEIAEALQLPKSLEPVWSARGYYGTLSHNSKAVYQRYIGAYDGNPATLNQLPPEPAARKFVEYMGGAAAVITRAREDFQQGNYRWVAQVMNQVVYAEPTNAEARALAADAYEQLGYLAESATWRNAYLLGAQELRRGVPPGRPRQSLDAEMIAALPAAAVFDYLGTTLNGPRADGVRMVLNWRFTDTGESIATTLDHAALTHVPGRTAANADAAIVTTREAFNAIVLRQMTFDEARQRGQATITGGAARFAELLALFDSFDPAFAVITP
jgi:alkyl sulfatase BDS1-like metallo-beta-lactamase superfamily hydrolase